MSVQTPKARPGRPYTLLGPDRRPYPSRTPGRYGGYRPCAVCLPAQRAAWKAAGKAAGAAPSPAPAVQRARQTAATRCPGRKRRRRPETSSPIRARAISAARGVARTSPPSKEGTREMTTANPPPTSTPTSPRTSPAPPSCRTSNGSSSRSTRPRPSVSTTASSSSPHPPPSCGERATSSSTNGGPTGLPTRSSGRAAAPAWGARGCCFPRNARTSRTARSCDCGSWTGERATAAASQKARRGLDRAWGLLRRRARGVAGPARGRERLVGEGHPGARDHLGAGGAAAPATGHRGAARHPGTRPRAGSTPSTPARPRMVVVGRWPRSCGGATRPTPGSSTSSAASQRAPSRRGRGRGVAYGSTPTATTQSTRRPSGHGENACRHDAGDRDPAEHRAPSLRRPRSDAARHLGQPTPASAAAMTPQTWTGSSTTSPASQHDGSNETKPRPPLVSR